jgi:cardiolipin synthase
VRLLRDAAENYPAWLDAIRSAEHSIHFESYIIHDDDIGAEFADLLAAKATEGVRVRVLYDWMGALGKTSRRFWRSLMKAGVDVRCFNPPRVDSPFGWLSRDHRKMIAVDGKVGYVTGLCIGRMWVGYPERGIAPWRDTGVEVRGPAVAEIERAFALAWETAGPSLPPDELPGAVTIPQAGNAALRVVATMPYTAGLYRLDQLIAAFARKTLWLTDAYFAGTSTYVQALGAAAMSGVDVRLLVPGGTDIPLLRPLSRAGYRPLLEYGVRVFEWNGPMMHAKTAVADRLWARVGSSNLNLASWLGNWELDVAIEDAAFAQEVEQMYVEDLANATEVVLSAKLRVRRPGRSPERRPIRRSGSAGRAVAGALRISNTVGAAMTNRRILGIAEAGIMIGGSVALLGLAAIAIEFPRLIAIPFAVLGVWVAIALLIKGNKLYASRRRELRESDIDPTPANADDKTAAESERG